MSCRVMVCALAVWGLSSWLPAAQQAEPGVERPAAPAPSPREVLEQRVRATNAHDLEAFLACHAEDVELGVYPDRSLGQGREHLRWIFEPAFARGDIRAELLDVLEAGPFVVAETRTTFGDEYEQGAAVYEVREGLIRSVRFLRDGLRAERLPVAR